MSAEKSEATQENPAELRVVVDAQIVLAMFLARRDRLEWKSPRRQLLRLLAVPSFRWLWSPDIISDYKCRALTIEADERITRHYLRQRGLLIAQGE